MLKVTPMTVKAACRHVGKNHRHNRAPQGGLFAAGVEENGVLVGVAICGRPVARLLDDGITVEITRVCTNGTRNACSILYGALCRAAAAIGYAKAITYTLKSEPGFSPRAAGFLEVATVGVDVWNRPNRTRSQTDLFGDDIRPPGEKIRWERLL